MHPSNWHQMWVTFRNVSQKNWIQAKGEIERSFVALRGVGASGSFEFGYSRVAFSASGCARAAANHPPVEQSEGKGASPLCFMQMKRGWLSAMTQPVPINKQRCPCVDAWVWGWSATVAAFIYIWWRVYVLFVCVYVLCTSFAYLCAFLCVLRYLSLHF